MTIPAPPPTGPRVTLWLLRLVATVFALLVLAQPILAGQVLAGDSDALAVHGMVAGFVILVSWGLAAAAVVFVLFGRGRLWPLWFAAAMLVAVIAQTAMGHSRNLGLHIPVGVAIVVLTVLLTVWVWRSGARRARGAAAVTR